MKVTQPSFREISSRTGSSWSTVHVRFCREPGRGRSHPRGTDGETFDITTNGRNTPAFALIGKPETGQRSPTMRNTWSDTRPFTTWRFLKIARGVVYTASSAGESTADVTPATTRTGIKSGAHRFGRRWTGCATQWHRSIKKRLFHSSLIPGQRVTTTSRWFSAVPQTASPFPPFPPLVS